MEDLDERLILSPGKFIGKNYRIIKELGYGAFSNVYKCIDVKQNIPVVIKCFLFTESKSANDEAATMKILNKIDKENKYFVKYYGSIYFCGHSCIVMEEFGMSLCDAMKIRDFSPLSVPIIRQIMYKLSKAIKVIHKEGIIHTDLKLENILLPPNIDINQMDEVICNNSSQKSNPVDVKQIDVRLVDFGSYQNSKQWHNKIRTTINYRAPEIIMGLKWNCECDIWSLGCILIELATGTIEFSHKDDSLHLFLIQHMVEPFPDWMCKQCAHMEIRNRFCWSSPLNLMKPDKKWSEELKKPPLFQLLKCNLDLADLALKMLRTDPFERISIDDIINHPFFDECR